MKKIQMLCLTIFLSIFSLNILADLPQRLPSIVTGTEHVVGSPNLNFGMRATDPNDDSDDPNVVCSVVINLLDSDIILQKTGLSSDIITPLQEIPIINGLIVQIPSQLEALATRLNMTFEDVSNDFNILFIVSNVEELEQIRTALIEKGFEIINN